MPFTRIYFLDVLLRVPPLFLMDVSVNYAWFPAAKVDDTSTAEWDASHSAAVVVRLLGMSSSYVLIIGMHLATSFCLAGVVGALFLFILPTDMLVSAYVWLTSVGTVLASNRTSNFFFESDVVATAPGHYFCAHLCLQGTFALLFSVTYRRMREGFVHRLFLVAVFVAPVFFTAARCIGIERGGVNALHVITLVQGFYVFLGAASHAGALLSIASHVVWWTRIVVRQNGLLLFLEAEWTRLQVPHVLRVFWLARFCEHLVLLTTSSWQRQDEGTGEALVDAAKHLLVRGCDTIVALLGMTSVVSSMAHHFGRAVQQFLATQDEDDKSFGTVSAILFFVLALQTGLTGLEPEKRFVRLYRNFCLLFTAVLHFVHNMVSPLLMSLSASRNRSISHHAKALLVCLFLVVFPCFFLTYLWSTHPVSTWLLAVSAFSIEVTVKVVISLLIYTLFMLDAYRNTFWERLDDYVYYVRATGNTVEFLFGIFLFFNGAWILLFESGGAIRAFMMCVHAYFNIWVQAKTGWKVFIRRRTAVNKINTFPEATAEQLQRLDDVCAICYQEMTTARITWCRHYFHALCLRKWLYVQDRCPMCHKALYQMQADDDQEEAEVEVPDAIMQAPIDGHEEENVAAPAADSDYRPRHVEVHHPHQD